MQFINDNLFLLMIFASCMLSGLIWIYRTITTPDFTRDNVIKRIANDFKEDQREAVLEMLDQWRSPLEKESLTLNQQPLPPEFKLLDGDDTLLAQVQLSILQIAKGNVQLVKKHAFGVEGWDANWPDYRDIIIKAGYGY